MTTALGDLKMSSEDDVLQKGLENVDNEPSIFPLENPLVVTHMMKYLDIQTLLQCRLVSHQYNFIATKILKKYSLTNFQLTLTFSSKQKFYYIERQNKNVQTKIFYTPLTKLNDHSESSQSPFTLFCTDFKIIGGSLSSPDLRHFISLHGDKIRKLYLNFNKKNDPDGLEAFRKLLLSKTPSLEHLHLQNLPTKWSIGQLFDDDEKIARFSLGYLPSLKILSIDKVDMRYSLIVGDLILMATNLEQLYNCPTPSMCQSEPRLKEKMKLVKGLSFHPEESNWDFSCQLAESTLNLTSLHLTLDELYPCPQSWSRIARTLNQILRSSQSTLEIFGTGQLSFLSSYGLEIPSRFENVHTLCLKFWKEIVVDINDWKLFPNSLIISELFPNVTKLKFNVEFVGDSDPDDDEDDGTWGDYFLQGGDILPKVNHLEFLDRIMDGKWLSKFAHLCPNVTILKIGTFSVPNFPEFCVEVAKYFQRVEHLHIFTFTSDPNSGYYEHDILPECTATMDSIMTGIPVGLCRDLRNVDVENLPILEDDERSQPSIASLQYLKSLTMDFPPIKFDEDHLLFSKISGIYGFEVLKERRKDLKVVFRAEWSREIERMLSPVLPYVDNMVWLL